MASNAELEAAILAAPDDPQAYLVYADWLQSQGDPRGELIVLQHRESAEAAEHLARHRAAFLGRFAERTPEKLELTWRYGFIRSAEIAWELFSHIDEDDTCGAQLAQFLALPSARFLEKLELGPVSGEDEMSFSELAEAISEARPANLRSLYLGATSDWDISGTSTAIPRSESIPAMRTLVLRGGSVTLDAIDLPELTAFTVQSGGLVSADLVAIATARWPKLEHLEIWFGDPSYGASGGVEDIRPILDAVGLANLRTLALRNCPFADELASALITSKILPQVRRLDLSMGNLSDRGIAAMLAAKAAFAHLAELDVDDNALTDASWPAARALAKQVTFGTDHTPERAVPRADGNRHRRFVSVGE